MKNKILYNIAFVIILCIFCSCQDFLDELPDNRTMLDTPEKIKELMVTAYPESNYWLLTELSSDNFVDNRAPNDAGTTYNLDPFERMDDEIFAWEDVRSASTQDSPYYVWSALYHSIATCNHALEAIDELEAKQDLGNQLDPQRGEALILRAYCHFMLANIFCKTYKDPETSKNDIGITYMVKPEKVVGEIHDRGNVAEVYEMIEKDIEAGIDLINNEAYDVPKYHFNKNAANAFAARFYLYKRDYEKVIKHANAVLGEGNPEAMLRDWSISSLNLDNQPLGYANVDEAANLMFIPTASWFVRRFMNQRYGMNGKAVDGLIDGGPTWSNRPSNLVGMVVTYDQKYGSMVNIIKEYFEYTDKVARTGFGHCLKIEFTTDALLLDRAEAYIFLNEIDNAVRDLQYWNKSHKNNAELTKDIIKSFYTPDKKAFVKEFNTSKLSPSFIVSEDQKPFVDCVLHFRRIERVHQGDRWFDLKRYGIEIEHIIGASSRKEILTYDDDRRAIQIPLDVIGAGLEPNPRTGTPADPSLSLKVSVDY